MDCIVHITIEEFPHTDEDMNKLMYCMIDFIKTRELGLPIRKHFIRIPKQYILLFHNYLIIQSHTGIKNSMIKNSNDRNDEIMDHLKNIGFSLEKNAELDFCYKFCFVDNEMRISHMVHVCYQFME